MLDVFAHIRYRGDQHTDCLLSETDPLAKTKRIEIHSGTSHRDWFLLHPDRDRRCPYNSHEKCTVNSPYLAIGNNIYHQVCDGILMMQDSSRRINVFYFDLKSKESAGVSNQFKSMTCFVRYILSLADNTTLPLQERAFCFESIGKKLQPKDTFNRSQQMSDKLGFPVFTVPVYNGQKFHLTQFCNAQ